MFKSNKLNTAKWFLDFVTLDLEALGEPEKRKLVEEILGILYGSSKGIVARFGFGDPQQDAGLVGVKIKKTISSFNNGNQLEKCQKHLKDFFWEMVKKSYDLRNQPKMELAAKDWNRFFPFAQFNTSIMAEFEIEFGNHWFIKVDKRRHKRELFFGLDPDEITEYPFSLKIRARRVRDALLFYFCQALEGIPIGALHMCPECNRWFLNLSKKKKIFCTQKCAARYSSREHRKQMKELKNIG